MDHCPKCQSTNIHRSRSRSRWDAWRKEITGKRLFRCHACDWRGWGVDAGPRFGEKEIEVASRMIAPDPPNLVNTPLVRSEPSTELELKQLDEKMSHHFLWLVGIQVTTLAAIVAALVSR